MARPSRTATGVVAVIVVSVAVIVTTSVVVVVFVAIVVVAAIVMAQLAVALAPVFTVLVTVASAVELLVERRLAMPTIVVEVVRAVLVATAAPGLDARVAGVPARIVLLNSHGFMA